jgi:outer membrane protein assembly factor BamB
VGDTVYVGGYNGILYALSLEGGELRRKARTQVGGPIVGSPVIVDGLALVGSSDGNLYAFDILVDDGELTFDDKWTFPTGNKIWSTPVVVDGVVYFGSLDHNVYAVSLEEGEKLWQFETGGAVVSTPVVTGGKVFVGSFDSVFYAIDAETAEEVWRFEGATKWFWAAAAAAKDTIYVPSLDGNLYALDMRTGGLLWTVETDAPIIGSPVIVFDMIAVPSADGKIWLANLKDESLESRCNIEEEIRTPLVEYEGSIYFGARDGSIRAMEIRRTGSIEEMWALFTDTGQVQSRWICTL